MADAIDIERLIGEVARRHNLLLSRDDPILVSVTLNELVLAALLSRLDQMLQNAEARVASSSVQHAEVMKEVAARLITASAIYADKEIRTAAQTGAAEIIAVISEQVALLKELSSAPKKSSPRPLSWWWTTIVSGASVLSAAIVVYFLGSLPSPPGCLPKAQHEAAVSMR